MQCDLKNTREQSLAPKRRVLFISYSFPPVGGAGVQRASKFVKYLPCFGWHPTVLTVANPSVPVMDDDLVDDIPSDVRRVSCRTLEPSYRHKHKLAEGSASHRPSATIKSWLKRWAHSVLSPDPQVLWTALAERVAMRELRSRNYDAIFATAPPFSSLLMASRLSKRSGIPLVVDFRDEWLLSSKYLENRQRTESQLKREHRQFLKVLNQADLGIATTRASAREIENTAQDAGISIPIHAIYNGFDPTDFESLSTPTSDTDFFNLTYTGTLWNLTDIQPLCFALRRLAERSPKLACRVRLTLIGRRTDEQNRHVEQLRSLPINIVVENYLPHSEALQRLNSADAVCLLLSDKPGAERVVPAKLFEYLALKKELLAITPVGEVNELLSTIPHASSFRAGQADEISSWLEKRIQEKLTSSPTRNTILKSHLPLAHPEHPLAWCSRPNLAQNLAVLLDQVVTAEHTSSAPTASLPNSVVPAETLRRSEAG